MLQAVVRNVFVISGISLDKNANSEQCDKWSMEENPIYGVVDNNDHDYEVPEPRHPEVSDENKSKYQVSDSSEV